MVTSSSEVEEAASEEGTGHGESRRPSHETPVGRGYVEELGKTSHVTGGRSVGSGAEYCVGFCVVYGVHLRCLQLRCDYCPLGTVSEVGLPFGCGPPPTGVELCVYSSLI